MQNIVRYYTLIKNANYINQVKKTQNSTSKILKV